MHRLRFIAELMMFLIIDFIPVVACKLYHTLVEIIIGGKI